MNHMFYAALSFDQNLASWNVSKVTSFENAFANAVAFQGRGLESWDVSSATTLSGTYTNNVALLLGVPKACMHLKDMTL